MGEEIKTCSILVTKTKGERTLERSKDKWEDNNNINSTETM
jgi:hypothetical protein